MMDGFHDLLNQIAVFQIEPIQTVQHNLSSSFSFTQSDSPGIRIIFRTTHEYIFFRWIGTDEIGSSQLFIRFNPDLLHHFHNRNHQFFFNRYQCTVQVKLRLIPAIFHFHIVRTRIIIDNPLVDFIQNILIASQTIQILVGHKFVFRTPPQHQSCGYAGKIF